MLFDYGTVGIEGVQIMSEKKQTFYVNGEFVPAAEAVLPVGDLSIVRGYGVFDFLRTYGGKPFHLMDHIERMRKSAVQIKLNLPHSNEEIAEIVLETLARNPYENAYIRLIGTGGVSPNLFMPGDQPTFMVMVADATAYPDSYYTEGIKIITTRLRREFYTVKSLNYIGAIMAQHEAVAVGAIEALYRDEDDWLSECTRANFMGIKGNQLICAEEKILEGITQKALLRVVAQHGELEVVRRFLHYDELAELDEAFICNSSQEILPVRQIDDIVIGSGTAGVKTTRCVGSVS